MQLHDTLIILNPRYAKLQRQIDNAKKYKARYPDNEEIKAKLDLEIQTYKSEMDLIKQRALNTGKS